MINTDERDLVAVQDRTELVVHQRVLEWAVWVRRHVDAGVGWPRYSISCRGYRAPVWPDSSVLPAVPIDVDDARAEEVDVALVTVGRHFPLNRQALVWKYLGDWWGAKTDVQKAAACGCSETVFKQRVAKALAAVGAIILLQADMRRGRQ